MSMPADAIAAILGGSPAPLHLWVMNETTGTTFADQVTSGATTLTAGSGCAPGAWGPLTGKGGNGGPLTQAATLDGTANGVASTSGPILGGRSLGWGIILWMDSTTTTLTNKTLYCERGSSGNDQIIFSINSGSFLSLAVCDDTAGDLITATTPTSNSIIRGGHGQYSTGGQMLGVSVDATGHVNFYVNGPFGIGQAAQTINSSHTWTNSGLTANIGLDPLNTANAFPGTLAWCCLFGAPFTADQFDTWYRAVAPTPAHGKAWTKATSGAVFPKSQFWNQSLDPAAPLDPNSSAIVSQLLAYWSAHSYFPQFAAAVPMQDLQTTGLDVAGLRTWLLNSSDQHAFMKTVPMPDSLISSSPFPANIGSDAIAWVTDSKAGLQWDAYTLTTTQLPGGSTPSTLISPFISAVTPTPGTGSLAAGAYFYSISAVNSNGEAFAIGSYNQDQKGTLSATGENTLTVLVEMGGTPPPTSWIVYRRGPYPSGGPFGTTADYQLLTTLTSFVQGSNSFVDDGSITPTTGVPITITGGTTGQPLGYAGTALTEDWAAKGGGGSWDWFKNAAFNPCWKPTGGTNNGESASSCPAGAGVVTLEEALTGSILHPIAVATSSANNWLALQGHQWPAPRHDGAYTLSTGNPTMEGMRLRLPASFDPNSLTYSTYTPAARLQKAFATALRDYGLIVRDSTPGGMLIYAEDASQTGRDGWPYVMGGLFSGALTANALLSMIPWSSMQVLMPARYPSKTDTSGRRTNRVDVAGFPTPVPY